MAPELRSGRSGSREVHERHGRRRGWSVTDALAHRRGSAAWSWSEGTAAALPICPARAGGQLHPMVQAWTSTRTVSARTPSRAIASAPAGDCNICCSWSTSGASMMTPTPSPRLRNCWTSGCGSVSLGGTRSRPFCVARTGSAAASRRPVRATSSTDSSVQTYCENSSSDVVGQAGNGASSSAPAPDTTCSSQELPSSRRPEWSGEQARFGPANATRIHLRTGRQT